MFRYPFVEYDLLIIPYIKICLFKLKEKMLGKASHLIFLCLCFIIQKPEGNDNSCSWSCLRMEFPDIGTAPIPAPSQEGELSWLLLCHCLSLACFPQLPGLPVAAVTNYQKHGGLKPHTSFPPSCGDQQSNSNFTGPKQDVSKALLPLEASGAGQGRLCSLPLSAFGRHLRSLACGCATPSSAPHVRLL